MLISRSQATGTAATIAAGLVLVAIAAGAVGCSGDAEPTAAENFGQAVELAANNNSLVLVEFYTDW
jgi:hypothetical protein